ncbi:Serine/arginine-rich SC35-like splicing factor SCL30A [Zea mays]|uniref:Serine/arginine-rich SC35-like splicing factor SCL30A n=1 Tax=Zea mays TaxID=4577 RepID=A0A3L6FK67_MAIZE|nr:Serine/arginine-rich SC35-like splicing factor SCL30A [Zea mays]
MTAREPRGFGFIQYFDPEDASDAKYHMYGKMLLGREIAVVFAEKNRKKPTDMRAREKKVPSSSTSGEIFVAFPSCQQIKECKPHC